jgi:cell division septation protein DedD
MNYLLDDDDVAAHTDREFTLSTGSILGLFFGLVLLCGLFFGFGYSVGDHKSPQPLADNATNTPAPTNFNAFKPAAGLPPGSTNNIPVTPQSSTTSSTTTSVATAKPISSVPPAAPGNANTPAPIVRVAPATPAHPEPISTTVPQQGSFTVQVAAVSHQEDADLLLNALRAKGYAVGAFAGQDKFIRIQIGPFSNRHDAEVIRQRLSADGYSPIIK